MRQPNPFWLSTTTASNEPVSGDTSFNPDDPAELYWAQFYGDPIEWVEPITDWTADDYYNYYDLNAVEGNTNAVAMLLANYTGQPIPITVVTDRDTRRFEYYDSLNRVEGNQQTLADHFYTPSGWEQPKTNWQSGQPFSYIDANRLERNLQLLYDLIIGTVDNLKYCGTFAAGEDGDIY